MNVGICGAASIKENTVGGQVDRTRNLVHGLSERLGEKSIFFLNTETYRNNIFLLAIKAIKLYFKNDLLIYIVSRRGNLFYTFLFGTLRLLKYRKLFCIVIGGPPISFFTKHQLFLKIFKNLDGSIYEVDGLREKMSTIGCKHTFFYPNGKIIRNVSPNKFCIDNGRMKVCTYSRISREKGIEDAILAVEDANRILGKDVYSLDIYGNVEHSFKDDFTQLIKGKEYIHFKGIIDRKDSVKVLKEYYLMLFPTHISVEGIPGGLIDSLETGVPIIATNVSYNASIVKSGYCGVVYDIENRKGLSNVLVDAANNPMNYIGMRENCLLEAKKYDTNYSMDALIDFLVKK